jgi:hypothetical protein
VDAVGVAGAFVERYYPDSNRADAPHGLATIRRRRRGVGDGVRVLERAWAFAWSAPV